MLCPFLVTSLSNALTYSHSEPQIFSMRISRGNKIQNPALHLFRVTPLYIRPRLFLDHLEKQEVGQLLDVVAIVDAVMLKGVAEFPEFAYYVGHKGPFFDRIDRMFGIFSVCPVYNLNPV